MHSARAKRGSCELCTISNDSAHVSSLCGNIAFLRILDGCALFPCDSCAPALVLTAVFSHPAQWTWQHGNDAGTWLWLCQSLGWYRFHFASALYRAARGHGSRSNGMASLSQFVCTLQPRLSYLSSCGGGEHCLEHAPP
jgi:hypothetical protein